MFRLFPCVKIHEEIDLDAPIYRFIPIDFMDEILCQNKLFFQSPLQWPDPCENISKFIHADDNATPFSVTRLFRHHFFCTCWSSEKSSEGLWRLYSTDKRHVRIKTTIRKLLKSSFLSSSSQIDCFIAPVMYEDLDNMSYIFNKVESDPSYIKYYIPLYLKRRLYAYEKEIRFSIIDLDFPSNYEEFVERDRDTTCLYLKLRDFNFIDEVEFDPRLNLEEFESQKSMVSQEGLKLLWNPLDALPKSILLKGIPEMPLENIPDNCKVWDGTHELKMKTVRQLLKQDKREIN